MTVNVGTIAVFPTNTRELSELLRKAQAVPDDDSVSTDLLKDGSVTSGKIADQAVAASKIGTAAVTTAKMADQSVTLAKLGIAPAAGDFIVRRGALMAYDIIADADVPASIARDTDISAAITAHEGEPDPHPQYLTATEGNAAYQPLAAVLSMLHTGTGSPEGVLTAAIGHLFLRTDGGASTTMYIKESGAGNTGWRAV